MLSDQTILEKTNEILNFCQLQPRFCSINDIQQNSSSIFVAILERILQEKLLNINRNPKTNQDYISNAQIFLQTLKNEFLTIDLSQNVTPQNLCNGDKMAISEILSVLSKLINLLSHIRSLNIDDTINDNINVNINDNNCKFKKKKYKKKRIKKKKKSEKKEKIYRQILNSKLNLKNKKNQKRNYLNEDRLIKIIQKKQKEKLRSNVQFLEKLENELERELILKTIREKTDQQIAIEKVEAEAKKLEKEYLEHHYKEYKKKFEILRNELETKTNSIKSFFKDQIQILNEERNALKKRDHFQHISNKNQLSKVKKELKLKKDIQLNQLCQQINKLNFNDQRDLNKLNKMIQRLINFS